MGAWYLLALFSFRLVLPEIMRIRGVIVLGILLTVFTCVMKGIGSEFALGKSLGFFVYFMAGYRMNDIPRNKVNKMAARIGLVFFLSIFMFVSWKTSWYKLALSVLCRDANVDSFAYWYVGPLVYLFALLLISVAMLLVANAIPEKCGWLEKQGTDTMPMYLSHLILFMAVAYLLNKDNWIITVGVSLAGIIISLSLFSAKWYRNLFNNALQGIKKYMFREN